MLELIIQILSYVKQIGYFGLVLSYKTGQLIVYGLKVLIDLLIDINQNLGAVLRVLLEDFYIFICDVGQRVLFIITLISEAIQGFIGCVASVVESIKFMILGVVCAITETYNAIFTTIAKVFAGVGQVIVMIKYLILLVGSGIWFVLTIVPLFIVYTCTMFTYYLGSCIDEFLNITTNTVKQGKNFINATYEFLTDVPLESVAGLIAGACIIYVIIKFQILLYQKLLSAFELIRQNSQQIRSRLIRSLTIHRQPQPVQLQNSSSESEQADSSNSSDESELQDAECTEDRVCIICQARNKCILMLPCRHVCLCNECNVRLRNYNRTCPICRSLVQKTMKVYV